MAENLTPKKYIDSNNMKQILAAVKSKTPVGDKYVTEEQLLAKDYATKTYVGEQIANAEHLKREIVTVLPSDTEASDNIIYMLKVESATGNDKYQEYMKIDGTVQMIGDTSVNLTDYAKKTDIPTTLPANGGNADTVNNHTVKSDVPENAVFTDTIYDDTELKELLKYKDISSTCVFRTDAMGSNGKLPKVYKNYNSIVIQWDNVVIDKVDRSASYGHIKIPKNSNYDYIVQEGSINVVNYGMPKGIVRLFASSTIDDNYLYVSITGDMYTGELSIGVDTVRDITTFYFIEK